MIDTNSSGTSLSSAYQNRIAKLFLDATRKPKLVFLLAREFSTVWTTRDISELFVQAGDIESAIARQYGVSRGSEADFSFSNLPLMTLSANYTSGTTLTVERRVTTLAGEQLFFELEANDWIEISGDDNTEYRRVTTVNKTNDDITSLVISRELDFDYNADETEIRFVYVRNNTADLLTPDDFCNGTLKTKLEFDDSEVSQEAIDIYQGTLIGCREDESELMTITCHSRLQELVEYELEWRVEFSDQGIVSPPTESGWNGEGTANTGTGIATDITYPVGKRPVIPYETEVWTLTYTTDSLFYNDIHYDISGWALSGSVTGAVPSNQDLPDTTTTNLYLATRTRLPDDPPFELKGRNWPINLLDLHGFRFSVDEGEEPFVDGDTFKFYSRAAGTIAVLEGKGYNSNPIKTGPSYLNPSYIIDYVVNDLLDWVHDNVETSISTNLITSDSLTAIRGNMRDQLAELRGWFPAGSRAIDIIDDALVILGGWMFSTEDDHLAITLYDGSILDSPEGFDLSGNYDDTSRTYNVITQSATPRDEDSIRNRIKLAYNVAEREKTVETVDPASAVAFGRRTLIKRAEDYTEQPLNTRFDVAEHIAQNTIDRILKRHETALDIFDLQLVPNAFLFQLADTPQYFSKIYGMAERIWITQLRKDLNTLTAKVKGERATHIKGKYCVAQDSPPRTASEIWDSTGFVGVAGEERLAYAADTTDQLDVLGNNDGDYDANLGTPDQWGNFVEDEFVAS